MSAKKEYISCGRESPGTRITLDLGGGFPRVTEEGGGCPNSALSLIDQHSGRYQPHQQSRGGKHVIICTKLSQARQALSMTTHILKAF